MILPRYIVNPAWASTRQHAKIEAFAARTPEELQAASVQRMAWIDNLSPEWRALVYKYSLLTVRSFIAEGYTAQQAERLIRLSLADQRSRFLSQMREEALFNQLDL